MPDLKSSIEIEVRPAHRPMSGMSVRTPGGYGQRCLDRVAKFYGRALVRTELTEQEADRVIALLSKCERDSQQWMDASCDPSFLQYDTIAFLNAHALNIARSNEAFFKILHSSGALLRDGIGVRIAMQVFGLRPMPNLNGTDLIPSIVRCFREHRVVLIGTDESTICKCGAKLQKEEGVDVVLAMDGFRNHADYIDVVRAANPGLVILCMGMPGQETLGARLRSAGIKTTIVFGGGWADFYSGVKPRAPIMLRRLGMEWLFRLAVEPRRLYQRYTLGVIAFLIAITRARLCRPRATYLP